VLLASSLDQVKATTQALLVWLVVGGLCIVFLVVVGVTLLVRNGLRPLNEMATVAEDITAQRLDQRLSLYDPPAEVARLAQTFDAMLQRLDEAFATQRRFVADASHELRTPLAALQGRSELLLLNPTLDAQTRAGLNMLREEAARMGRMVANLLLVAQGDERHKLDLRRVELDDVLLQVAQEAYTLTAGTQIKVTLHQEDRAEVLGDADLLKQALLNLVDNALTHMPQGGRLALSLSVSDGMALVSVSDTGHGIAATHLPHLFERFYRVDPARSRRNGGAGLGLSIVQWIVEAHGGRVGVESRIGHGSVFTMTLPLSDHTLTDS
jgi:heavy metal sensor kinase